MRMVPPGSLAGSLEPRLSRCTDGERGHVASDDGALRTTEPRNDIRQLRLRPLDVALAQTALRWTIHQQPETRRRRYEPNRHRLRACLMGACPALARHGGVVRPRATRSCWTSRSGRGSASRARPYDPRRAGPVSLQRRRLLVLRSSQPGGSGRVERGWVDHLPGLRRQVRRALRRRSRPRWPSGRLVGPLAPQDLELSPAAPTWRPCRSGFAQLRHPQRYS